MFIRPGGLGRCFCEILGFSPIDKIQMHRVRAACQEGLGLRGDPRTSLIFKSDSPLPKGVCSTSALVLGDNTRFSPEGDLEVAVRDFLKIYKESQILWSLNRDVLVLSTVDSPLMRALPEFYDLGINIRIGLLFADNFVENKALLRVASLHLANHAANHAANQTADFSSDVVVFRADEESNSFKAATVSCDSVVGYSVKPIEDSGWEKSRLFEAPIDQMGSEEIGEFKKFLETGC